MNIALAILQRPQNKRVAAPILFAIQLFLGMASAQYPSGQLFNSPKEAAVAVLSQDPAEIKKGILQFQFYLKTNIATLEEIITKLQQGQLLGQSERVLKVHGNTIYLHAMMGSLGCAEEMHALIKDPASKSQADSFLATQYQIVSQTMALIPLTIDAAIKFDRELTPYLSRHLEMVKGIDENVLKKRIQQLSSSR